MYEKEVKNCLDAGILEKCGTEPSKWSSKVFPMLKGSGDGVHIVADFKKLNKTNERPTSPTKSSSQLLRHISPNSKYFVLLDLTSGYHQVRVDKESQDLLCITTSVGRYRYTVLGQRVTIVSDIFNYLIDGGLRINGMNCIKNMDGLLIYSDTLEGLKKGIRDVPYTMQKEKIKAENIKILHRGRSSVWRCNYLKRNSMKKKR